MKRVLVVASSFPPQGGIAQARIASFVRHLPSYGWEPEVVTIGRNEGNSDCIDETLLDEEHEKRVVLRRRETELRRKRASKFPPLLRTANFTI
jgi:hypothetical protein